MNRAATRRRTPRRQVRRRRKPAVGAGYEARRAARCATRGWWSCRARRADLHGRAPRARPVRIRQLRGHRARRPGRRGCANHAEVHRPVDRECRAVVPRPGRIVHLPRVEADTSAVAFL